jgi:hypothetical protein
MQQWGPRVHSKSHHFQSSKAMETHLERAKYKQGELSAEKQTWQPTLHDLAKYHAKHQRLPTVPEALAKDTRNPFVWQIYKYFEGEFPICHSSSLGRPESPLAPKCQKQGANLAQHSNLRLHIENHCSNGKHAKQHGGARIQYSSNDWDTYVHQVPHKPLLQ